MPYTPNGDWEKIVEGSRRVTFTLKIIRGISSTNISSESISNVSIESAAVANNSITFGSTCSDSVKISLRNYESRFLVENARIRLGVMVGYDNNSKDYKEISIGDFYVDSLKKTETGNGLFNIDITAYDGFYKTETVYTPSSSLSLPASIRTVINDILSICGLDEAIDISAWSNTITVDSIKEGLTCRQQIGYLAALQGCFAKFDENGNLTARWYTNTDKVITADEQFLAEMTLDTKSALTVKTIETGTTDNVIVKPESSSGYSIKFENPYITDDIAESIYNDKISGDKISFYPLSVRWRGNPKLVVGDIVKVEDGHGNYLTCYIMQKSLSFDGGMSETYKCYGESTSSVAFSRSPSDIKFERIYSRMEEAVKVATSAVKQTQGSTFELIPDSNDSSKNIGYKLYYKDSSDSAFDDCVIMATAGGIGFSTNGGDSFDAAAMYFAKGADGKVHGYINGETIYAGSISADKIDTSQLIISQGNVSGLDNTISEIDGKANTANSTANSAKTAAEGAKDTVDGWSVTENNVTYINGGMIYTGSITAEKIAANSITTDKLSAGQGELANLFYNPDFSKSDTAAWGWEGYNTLLVKNSGYVEAQYLALNTNLIDSDTSEFFSTSGWHSQSGTINKPYASVDYIQFTPSSASSEAAIWTAVRLENGKRYSVAAQINAYGWTSTSSRRNRHPIGVVVGNWFKFAQFYSFNDFTPATGEHNVEFVFDYDGQTSDSVDVGLCFDGLLASDGSPTGINIAWISCCEVETTRALGFYSSNKNWLASNYKTSNLINGGTYVSSASAYLANVYTVSNPDMQIVLQKKVLESGKRYVLLARMQFVNLSSINSGAVFGWWQGVGKSYLSTNLSSTTTSQYFTAKFVFDYTDQTQMVDVGIYWRGILNDGGQPCKVRISWFQLYQDDTEAKGFYATDPSLLTSQYKQNHLINVDNPSSVSAYNKKSALTVYNNKLYLLGEVQGNIGHIGCLQYTPSGIAVNGSTYYFEDKSKPSSSVQESIASYLKIQQPDGIIDLSDVDTLETVGVATVTSVGIVLEQQASGSWSKTDLTPAGVRCTDSSGDCVILRANGIGLDSGGGLAISLAQLKYLANNTPTA